MIKTLPPGCQKLLEAKCRSGLTFEAIAKKVGRDEVWVAALFYGQAQPSKDDINTLAALLNLSAETLVEDFVFSGLPTRGGLIETNTRDPVLYRFFEIFQNYGVPLKAILQEKFGDGIMSAVNFKMHVDKVPTPKGDRVKITLDGAFLPYKPW
ncbi:Cyanate hydratase [Dimargaris cristalligena]|uniref:Cyanate hydratase n=1 Tax=Dimargaris cristalligena TaxID=215637 RepID=A0A4P9ZTS1_9FUNG|nr:Cyanate hydratase [Dimargaris cristalligena]RKP36241.1 cyanate hydratase [Dimargaris cristalligena]|eukprot:RKP36241.1 cyanate hydratase [Dimargaris cristalligena]